MATQANTSLARRRTTFRRGAVVLLAVVCFGLLSAYLREGDTGPLHRFQDGAGALVAPVQGVAVAAIEPFRDAWGWANDLRDARSRAADLETEVAELRAAIIADAARSGEVAQLEALEGIAAPYLDDYRPVEARVDGQSPSAYSRQARLDQGTVEGVVANAPVLAGSEEGGALVGKIISAQPHSSTVAFVTDGGRTQVGATLLEGGSLGFGLVRSSAPGELELTDVPRDAAVTDGQVVITRGSSSLDLPSLYPAGIPIGLVSSSGGEVTDAFQSVQVTPLVDPRELQYMVVLVPTSEEAQRRARG